MKTSFLEELKVIQNNFLKIPYKFQGRNFDGVDCWGLVVLFFKIHLKREIIDLDNEDYTFENYKKDNLFIENYHKQWEKIETPKAYDLIFFKDKETGLVTHCGIYLWNNFFLQATAKHNVTFCRLSVEFKNKIEGFYRIKNNDNN